MANPVFTSHEQEGTLTWKPNSSDVKPEELWLSLIGTLNGVLHAMLAAEQKGNDKPIQDFLGLLRAFITKHAFGDGGVMVTNNHEIYEFIIKARNHGLRNRDECDFWSCNSRLDEVQAAMLLVQLRYLEKWTEKRRKLAFRYNQLLKPYVDVPEEESEEEYCVYQTYVIQASYRDELWRFLKDHGVQANVHYPLPLYMQKPALSLGYREDDFPVTKLLSQRILSLPLYPELTHGQQDYVAELLNEFYKGK